MVITTSIQLLGQPDLEVQIGAYKELLSLGTAVVEPLITALNEGPVVVQRYAAKLLGEIGDARAVGPLRNALDNPNRTVWRFAQEGLQRLGFQDKWPTLEQIEATWLAIVNRLEDEEIRNELLEGALLYLNHWGWLVVPTKQLFLGYEFKYGSDGLIYLTPSMTSTRRRGKLLPVKYWSASVWTESV